MGVERSQDTVLLVEDNPDNRDIYATFLRLGLAISRKLVTMLGGSIDVESSEGEGTRFSIDLPVRLESEAGAFTPDIDLPAIPPGRGRSAKGGSPS